MCMLEAEESKKARKKARKQESGGCRQLEGLTDEACSPKKCIDAKGPLKTRHRVIVTDLRSQPPHALHDRREINLHI